MYVLFLKRVFYGHDVRDTVRRNADNGIGELLREVKLVQAQDNCSILFFCKPTQNRHELRFTFNVEK